MFYDGLPGNARQELNLIRGEYVFHQGDKTLGMFLVTTGKIQLQRHTRAGATVIIHTAMEGDTFAEAALFSDTYHCDAIAIKAGQIVRFDRQQILSLLETNQQFAIALTRQFAIQMQSYRRKIELQAIKSARERVYSALAEGLMTSDIKTFAFEIGLTHETVYRALSTLTKNRKIIKAGRGRYRVR